VNTGTARIVIIVALLVTGGLLLANGFDDTVASADGPSDTVTSPSPSPTATDTQPTKTPEPTPEPAEPKDTLVAVFNGTNTTGLAGTVLEDLIADGYTQGQIPTDAPNKPVDKTVVYYVTGPDAEQNQSNATDLAKKYYSDAKVKELDPAYSEGNLVEKNVQVVIVLGSNDVPASG
jgi:hypothetical protein